MYLCVCAEVALSKARVAEEARGVTVPFVVQIHLQQQNVLWSQMVVLKLPVQSRARSRELSVFTVQAFVKIMFLSTVPVQSQCHVAKHSRTLSRVDSVQVGKK